MKRTPRNDPFQSDKFGVKAKLSEYANSLYQKEWIDAGSPDKITIGDHVFSCDPKNWEMVMMAFICVRRVANLPIQPVFFRPSIWHFLVL